MEDFFLPPKAKAPVIFKAKIASVLEFHIQFWVQKSRRPFSDFLLFSMIIISFNY